MRNRIHVSFMLLLLGVFTWLSCSNGDDCSTENTSYARFNFYDPEGLSAKLDATISVTAAGTDSVLVNQESSATGLLLPLSYTNEEDTFVIHYTTLMRDSIFLSHTNVPFFISMDCGTAMFHKALMVRSTHNVIDSVELVNPEINFDYHENFKIYYSTLLAQ